MRRSSATLAALLLLAPVAVTAEASEGADPPAGITELFATHCPDAPVSVARAALLDALAARPGYRTLDEIAAPTLAPDVLRAAEAEDAAFGAARAWAAWVVGGEITPAPSEGCLASEITLLIAASSAPDSGTLPALRALLDTTRLPSPLVRHVATWLYLHESSEGLGALAPAAGADGAYVAALAANLAGEPASPSGATADGEPPVNGGEDAAGQVDAWAAWVRAETARKRGAMDEAVSYVEEALRADAFFAPALLTRAAVRVATGAEDIALSDLQHLRLGFGHESRYEPWIRALERRIR